MAPSGERTRWSESDSVRSLALREQGFYEIRGTNAATAGRTIAVNPDATESELGKFPADELARAVAPAGAANTSATTVATLSVVDREKRQTLWWYVLVVALLLLAAESLLSNQLSRAARRDVALAEGRLDHA